MKKFFQLILVLLLCSACNTSGQASEPIKITVPPKPSMGIYEGCKPSTSACLENLDTIAKGGFNVVLNYAALQGTPQDIKKYAWRAKKNNLKIIWSLKDFSQMDDVALQSAYDPLFTACACSDRVALLKFAVNVVRILPATQIYYLADEPTSDDYSHVGKIGKIVHDVDPVHKRLVVISYATGSSFLPIYASASFVDIIALDYYPIGRTTNPKADLDQLATIAKSLQQTADKNHKQALMSLQAHSLSQNAAYDTLCQQTNTCQPPTQEQMRQELVSVEKNTKSNLVLWYSYPYVQALDNQWKTLSSVIKG